MRSITKNGILNVTVRQTFLYRRCRCQDITWLNTQKVFNSKQSEDLFSLYKYKLCSLRYRRLHIYPLQSYIYITNTLKARHPHFEGLDDVTNLLRGEGGRVAHRSGAWAWGGVDVSREMSPDTANPTMRLVTSIWVTGSFVQSCKLWQTGNTISDLLPYNPIRTARRVHLNPSHNYSPHVSPGSPYYRICFGKWDTHAFCMVRSQTNEQSPF